MPTPPSRLDRFVSPVLWTAAAALVHSLRFGYAFGSSDQEEFLPWLAHRIDPGLFANDWFVELQQAAFNVRSAFVWVLEPVARLIGIAPAVLLAYALCWLALGSAIYALSRRFGGSETVAGLTVIAVLCITPQWTLGGNDVVHSMLVPSMAAWGAGLWAVVYTLHRRPVAAGLLTALAGWLQLLVGFHVGAALLVGWAVRGLWRQAGAFASIALVGIAPMVGWLWMAGGAVSAGGPDLFYILAEFRVPHHYLPSSFPLGAWVRTLWVAAAAGYALYRVRRSMSSDLIRFVLGVFGTCLAALIIGWIATEGLRILPITVLQPSKQTVLLKVVGITVFVAAFGPLLEPRIPAWLLQRSGWAVVIAFGWLAGLQSGALESRPSYDFEAVTAATPRDAVFLVPPSLSDFRFGAQRAVVVDFKAVPFGGAATRDWFERLDAVAPVNMEPRAATARLLPALDHSFESWMAADLRLLGNHFGAAYAVRRTPLDGAVSLGPGPFFVYAIAELP